MKFRPNNSLFMLCLVCCGSLFAQNKQYKLNEKLAVNNDVIVNLNTSHTNIIFETWNKNSIEVEAYLEGDVKNENSTRILDSWKVDIRGNNNEIIITSAAGNLWSRSVTTSNIEINKDNIKELQRLSPLIADMLGPLMANIAKNPMPSTLSENLASIDYGNKKYTEEEAAYIKQWENQIREKFSEEIKNGNISKNINSVVPINVSGQQQIQLSTWGKQYGQQMDAWASQLLRDIESQQSGVTNLRVYQYSSNKVNTKNTSKIIKVRMPKGAQLRLNARHGNIKLAEKANNLKASLSHTVLSANIIDGKNTFIKASYSPVYVQEWNHGRLVVNYVKNCRIQTAKNLLVNADSSNIYIQKLDENGSISGSFGIFTIEKLGESFSTLDLVVQNSDFNLNLPKTAFNLSYSGSQSLISMPRTLEVSTRKNFGNVFINGFQNTRSTDKMITINAKYSEVVLKN